MGWNVSVPEYRETVTHVLLPLSKLLERHGAPSQKKKCSPSTTIPYRCGHYIGSYPFQSLWKGRDNDCLRISHQVVNNVAKRTTA